MVKRVFHAELSLGDGLAVLAAGRAAYPHELPAGRRLFLAEAAAGRPLACALCGAAADRFILEHHRNERTVRAVLNLWGRSADGGLVMFTRDHVIPKARGGSDAVANLRIACDPCNCRRGHRMSEADLAFEAAHPELIDPARLEAGRRNLAKMEGQRSWRRDPPTTAAEHEARRVERGQALLALLSAKPHELRRDQRIKRRVVEGLLAADPEALVQSDRDKRRTLLRRLAAAGATYPLAGAPTCA